MATVKIIGIPLCCGVLLPNADPLSNRERPVITGAPAKTWAMGMPEFLITDLGESRAFWTGVPGFRIASSRPEQEFVCLEHPDGAQRLMYPRDGGWDVGAMERPFGRGVVFQVCASDVDAMVAGGQREFLVQDPGGYPVMVAQRIGEKPLD
jgi:hypothetical protein